MLKKDISRSKAHTLVNLASDEYSKAVDLKNLGISVVGVKFLQRDGGREKFVSFFAKQARGLMARWMSECRPKTANDLKKFNVDGYKINTSTSSSDMLIFSRPKPRPKKS